MESSCERGGQVGLGCGAPASPFSPSATSEEEEEEEKQMVREGRRRRRRGGERELEGGGER